MRRVFVGFHVLLFVFLLELPVSGQSPTIASTATKKMASEWFSTNGATWPGFGIEGNGSYYYPAGFVAIDPRTSQNALFLFVQGGQSDSANILIHGGSFPPCGRDKVYLLIMPATNIGTQTNTIGPPHQVFKSDNTIWVSDNSCPTPPPQGTAPPSIGAGFGPASAPRDHRNNDRFLLNSTDMGYTELVESPSSLGFNQYRTWINRRVLTLGITGTADTPIHFDLAPSQTSESFIGSTLQYREWEGLLRFNDNDGCPWQTPPGCKGALELGRVKLRFSTVLYGTTNPWRVFIVDDSLAWHMVNPTTKLVDFDIWPYSSGLLPMDVFQNQFGWYESWLVDYTQQRGSVPPGCTTVGDADNDGICNDEDNPQLPIPPQADLDGDMDCDYRRGWTGERLVYYRWWANSATSSNGFAATKINLMNGSSPWSPYRPAHLDYLSGREGAMRVNFGGKRYLFSAHNDTNICDDEVNWPFGDPKPQPSSFQGLYVTVEELSFYNAQ